MRRREGRERRADRPAEGERLLVPPSERETDRPVVLREIKGKEDWGEGPKKEGGRLSKRDLSPSLLV